MKRILIIILLSYSSLATYGQNKTLAVGTPTANPNAALHVESPTNNQGILIPRLTTAQRVAMASLPLTTTDEGLMVYDKDLNVTFLWDGTSWQSPAKVSKYFITDPTSIDTALTASTNSNQPHGYALSAIHKGTGDVAGFFLVDNAASNFPAVYGEQRGTGAAIMGAKWTTSTGSAGAFLSGNAANPNNALYAWSNSNVPNASAFASGMDGTGGNAGFFSINNAASTYAGLYGTTTGTGPAVMGETASGSAAVMGLATGANNSAGYFAINNAGNTSPVLNISSNGTGNAITANRPIQATQFIGDGSGLTNVVSSPVTFPFANTTTASASTMFDIANTGTGTAGSFSINNAGNSNSAFVASTNGTGNAGRFLNTLSGETLYTELSGTGFGHALRAVHSGASGGSARFNTTNPANNATSLGVTNQGLGTAAGFSITNASNSNSAIVGTTDGTGAAIFGSTGTGYAAIHGVRDGSTNGHAGLFETTDAANTYETLKSTTVGSSAAGLFINSNATSPSAVALVGQLNSNVGGTAINGYSQGTGGHGGTFDITNSSNNYPALYATTSGTGSALEAKTSTGFTAIYGRMLGTSGKAAILEITNPSNTDNALVAQTSGSGSAGYFEKTGTDSPAALQAVSQTSTASAAQFYSNVATNPYAALYANTSGVGPAGEFITTNAANNKPALQAESTSNTSGSVAIAGRMSGTGGPAGYFDITNAASTFSALYATTNALNGAAYFTNTNAANNFSTLSSITNGNGAAGFFQNSNTANASSTLYSSNAGSGNAIAVRGDVTNASNAAAGVYGSTAGTGVGVYGITTGTGAAIQGYTSTGGTAIYGLRDGATNGNAGLFQTSNSSNNAPALQIVNAGNSSSAIYVNHTGSGGNLLVLTNSDVPAARIDKTGKGFFNSGTQTGGADLAELFDVKGTKSEYEPGDVLVISESTDRTVEKSFGPNSTKVAGVYATKPGVTLTEKDMNESTDALVPLGVIGVIPTKVCLENGPIKRGDLLVTSSSPGRAMKAITEKGDGIYPAGVILGKALENYDGTGSGLIKVLVNVK